MPHAALRTLSTTKPPIARCATFEIPVVVLHKDGIVIKPSQTFATQQVRQAVASLFELGIGHALSPVLAMTKAARLGC
jgi:hypothetical protein